MRQGSELGDLAAAWYYLEHFGFASPPPQSDPEVARNMATCLLTVASGDGHVSDEERRWILGYFATKGYPAAVIEATRTMTPTDAQAVPGLMQLGVLRQSARILLYDAIRAASSDGYHPGEMKAVRAVARALGVDDETVTELEALAAEEEALKAKRIKILMPQGHPSLHEKYRP
jgi:uncharacterized membrane protein YebE (DUF533 family)